MSTWYRKLEAFGSWPEIIDYAKTKPSFAAAWRDCERGDWMIWILANIGTDRKKLVLAAMEARNAAAIAAANAAARNRAAARKKSLKHSAAIVRKMFPLPRLGK